MFSELLENLSVPGVSNLFLSISDISNLVLQIKEDVILLTASLQILLLEISNSVKDEVCCKQLISLIAPDACKLFSLIWNICSLVL